LDRARGRVAWHLNLDVGVSEIDDCRIGPVKSDAGRALQVISQNSDLPADSACVGERLHEWAKACGQAVNRAAVGATRTVAAGVRRSVKESVGGLKDSRERVQAIRASRLAAKVVQHGIAACRRDFENHTCIPAPGCCAIQVSIAALGQPRNRPGAVNAVRFRAETVENAELPGRSELKNRATAVGSARCCNPADLGCSIEVSVRGLYQRRRWISAVAASRLRAERVQGCECTRVYSEDRASRMPAAGGGCAVQIAIVALDQPGNGLRAIDATGLQAEAMESGELARGSNLENRTHPPAPPSQVVP